MTCAADSNFDFSPKYPVCTQQGTHSNANLFIPKSDKVPTGNLSFHNSHSFVYANVRSIKNKILDLKHLISFEKPSVIVLTETWLNDTFPTSMLGLNHYNVYRNDRAGRGGGVLIAISSDLESQQINTFSSSEILTVKVKINRKLLNITACYLPQISNNQSVELFFKDLKSAISTENDVILLGDFNLPHVNWQFKTFPNSFPYKLFENFYKKSQP